MSLGSILVIDDHPDILDALEVGLTLEGYQIIAALSRDEALTQITEQRIDIVLMDYCMPGLSGVDFQLQLRKLGQNPQIILLTGVPDPAEKARELKLRYFLGKPFEFETLLQMMKACLTERATWPITRVTKHRYATTA